LFLPEQPQPAGHPRPTLTIPSTTADNYAELIRRRQAYVPIEERIRELLAANELPDVALVLNGVEVRPMFSRRGGSRVALDGSWGDGTSAVVKAFRRPPGDRQGAYYVRLNGLFMFKAPSQRGNLKADVVVDLSTTVRPGQPGYPLNAARDALLEPARWTFEDLVDEVEKENESVGRSQEDEVFDPESDDAAAREGAREIADLTAEAFADEDFRRTLAEAAGGIADFYGEMAKYAAKETPVGSLAPPGSKAAGGGDGPSRPTVLPPGMRVAAAAVPVEPDVAAPGGAVMVSVRQLRTALEAADEVVRAGGGGGRLGVLTDDVRRVLAQAEAGEALTDADASLLADAVGRAADSALGRGGGGLLQAAALADQAGRVLDAVAPARASRVRRNPFGKLAGLRISRKNYDRSRAYRFKKHYGRWIPHLTAWDATLRLVAAEARIARRFKPGFVLDDELMGLAATTLAGGAVVYVHPDRFAQVVRAHRERPLAVAAFLHGLAVHELTHLDGRMGEGHSEAFVAAREDLGAATAHLLPAVAVLVSKVLGLPAPTSEADRRVARLERDLEKARTAANEHKARAAALVREAEAQRGQARVTTPGTRVGFATLAEWLAGWRAIEGRKPSAARHAAHAAHLEALPDALVESADLADVDALAAIVERECPPRGQRFGRPTTRLADAVDRARHRARSPAERILDAAAAALRARPPAGVDLAYVEGFLARNRPALLRVVGEHVA